MSGRKRDDKDARVVGLQEVADLLGVARSTAEAYRSRGQLPEPDLPPTIESGKARPTWRRETLKAWHASRPRPREPRRH